MKLQQPKPRQFEIRKQYIQEIVEELQSIPEDEKKRITELTLKQTAYDDYGFYDDVSAAQQLAKLLSQLPALTSFTFYFRFYLVDHRSFTMLKESLKKVPNIRLLIDPQYQEYENPSHWAKEWQSGKDPRRSVSYAAWDWK